MTPSQKIAAATAIASAIAIPAEGLRQYAYRDPAGILTVCVGHTGQDIIQGKHYSLQECDKFLSDDMRKAIEKVDSCAPGLPVNTLAAFGDAAFNMGPTIVCNQSKSTAARLIKAGRIAEACEQIPRWGYTKIAGVNVQLPGTATRREIERQVCLKGLS